MNSLPPRDVGQVRGGTKKKSTYYDVLGLQHGESDTAAIQAAADACIEKLRRQSAKTTDTRAELDQKIAKIETMRDTLLNEERRAKYNDIVEKQTRRSIAEVIPEVRVLPVAMPLETQNEDIPDLPDETTADMGLDTVTPPPVLEVLPRRRQQSGGVLSTLAKDMHMRVGAAVVLGASIVGGIGVKLGSSGGADKGAPVATTTSPKETETDTPVDGAADIVVEPIDIEPDIEPDAAIEEESTEEVETGISSFDPNAAVAFAPPPNVAAAPPPPRAETRPTTTPIVVNTVATNNSTKSAPAAERIPQEPQRPVYVPADAIWNPTTRSWYSYLPEPADFNTAAQIAASRRATVVMIDSEEESQFVYKLPARPTEIWTGLVKGNDGQLYRMNDGKLATFTKWNNGEGMQPHEKNTFLVWGAKLADSDQRGQRGVCLEWEAPPVSAATAAADRIRSERTGLNQTQAAEVTMVEIDMKKFNAMRESLRESVKATSSDEKIEAILAFGKNPEVLKSPEAIKAVYAEAFMLSMEADDYESAKNVYERMKSFPSLFSSNEQGRCLSQVIALLKHISNKPEFRRLQKATERQEMTADMVELLNELAARDLDAAIELLKDLRKMPGAQPREVRDAFEENFDAVEADLKKLKMLQERNRLEDQELERIALLLQQNPHDRSALASRGMILLGRGDISAGLTDLSASESEHQQLAQESIALLAAGSAASGRRSLDAAESWERAATRASNGQKTTMQHVAIMLYDLALTATNEALDPFKKMAAKSARETLSSALQLQPAPPMKGQSNFAGN